MATDHRVVFYIAGGVTVTLALLVYQLVTYGHP